MLDAFFIQHFKIWPDGCKPELFCQEQKEFVFFLLSMLPALSTVRSFMAYRTKLEEIEAIDFTAKIDRPDYILQTIASTKNITLEAYKKELAKTLKEQAIDSLKEDFSGVLNLESEAKKDEDPRVKVLKHYQEMAAKLETKIPETEREDAVRKLFEKPDTLKKNVPKETSITGETIT